MKKGLIDLDFSPHRDYLHSGLLVSENRQTTIMLNFNEKTRKFDGVSVFRTRDISKWRAWDKKDLKDLKTDNRKEFLAQLKPEKMKTFYSCFKNMDPNQAVAFFTDQNVEDFYVGHIKKVEADAITVSFVDNKGKKTKTKKVKLSHIDDFSFLGSYEAKFNVKSK